MTDPFAVELRKHLVETADEVVRLDQLERIERLVGTVHQQAPWYVRLRWLISPWAPYANAGVRTALVAAVAVLILTAMIGIVVVGVGSSGQGPPPSSPFEGSWRSTDPGDGSALKLVVGPGETPDVHFEDAIGAYCRVSGDVSVLFVADGTGLVDGDRMVVSFPSGGCVNWQVEAFVTTFDRDPVTDMLINNANEVWVRDLAPSSAP